MLTKLTTLATLAVSAEAIPATMRAAVANLGLGCSAPDFSCVNIQPSYPTPSAVKSNEVMIQVKASSVNPYNIDLLELPHAKSVIGGDASGVVVAVGSGADCAHLSIGSEVWVFQQYGAYAEYVKEPCKATGVKPVNLSFVEAGTSAAVGMTGLQCLTATGAPWADRENVTVVITSGQGGTGFISLQLAKALGATTVITAASGDGIPFVKALGADVVVDYMKENIFDYLEDDSVDIVYDNFGAKGTADKAMHAIRSGGVYLVMASGGGGTISKHPKEGVKQISFGFLDPSDRTTGLDVLSELYNQGKWEPRIQAKYPLSNFKDAFNMDLSGKVMGKLSIVI